MTKRMVDTPKNIETSREAPDGPLSSEHNYLEYAKSIFNSSNLDKFELVEAFSKKSSPSKFTKKRKGKMGSEQGKFQLLKHIGTPKMVQTGLVGLGSDGTFQSNRLGNLLAMKVQGRQIIHTAPGSTRHGGVTVNFEKLKNRKVEMEMKNQEVGINTGVSLHSSDMK